MNIRRLQEKFKNRRFYHSIKDWLLVEYWLKMFHRKVVNKQSSLIKIRMAKEVQPLFVRTNSSDCAVLAQIFVDGEYDFLLKYELETMHAILDLGANIGIFARWIHAKIPQAHLVCIEPDSNNFAVLEKNISAASMQRGSDLVQACVVANHRPVYLNKAKGAWGICMVETVLDDDIASVTITLSEILSKFVHISYIDLLKCDIEGAEQEIFRDCADWIFKVKMLIVETHSPYTPAKLITDLERNGGKFRLLAENYIGYEMYVVLLQQELNE